MHIDARLTPFVPHKVSFLTVHVKSTVTGDFISHGLSKVDSEIPVPMGEGVGVIVERDLEPRSLVPSDRASDVSHCEDRFKPGHDPRPGRELQLTVALPVEPVKTFVTDGQVRM
jgi:hypothetical protein